VASGMQISKETWNRLKKVMRNNPELSKSVISIRFGISITTVAKAQAELKEEQKDG